MKVVDRDRQGDDFDTVFMQTINHCMTNHVSLSGAQLDRGMTKLRMCVLENRCIHAGRRRVAVITFHMEPVMMGPVAAWVAAQP